MNDMTPMLKTADRGRGRRSETRRRPSPAGLGASPVRRRCVLALLAGPRLRRLALPAATTRRDGAPQSSA